jgi:hypothetical protein
MLSAPQRRRLFVQRIGRDLLDQHHPKLDTA